MIVYGDPSEQQSMGEICARLGRWIAEARVARVPVPLDPLRSLLIEAGQLEQAAGDAPVEMATLAPRVCALTDLAAGALAARWSGRPDGDVRGRLDQLSASIHSLSNAPDLALTVKVPEGFAFYALYPEQYCAAAAQWIADHASEPRRRVLVAGIRSIGTGLSAIVAAELAAAGWEVRRTTLRPTGHPFAREAHIDPPQAANADWAIVVDEGPGVSGSSMAAVGRALIDAGIPRGAISFFPGHGRGPGEHASQYVRQWWATTPMYLVPLENMRWDGRSLVQMLTRQTPGLLHTTSPADRMDDLSGGLWRAIVFNHSRDRPAAFPAFERAKFRCTTRDGQMLLWKFAGLSGGVERAVNRLVNLSRGGWTAGALGHAMGFVAMPWVDGVPMNGANLNPELMSHMAGYISAAAGTGLCATEQKRGFDRLATMLEWNTRELLGDADAGRAQQYALRVARTLPNHSVHAYGDGRMAPHEWMRQSSGRMVKVDCFGHDRDHTIIGRQPLAWDVAGAAVEWEFDPQAQAMLAPLGGAASESAMLLPFYRMAYAAFRAGLCQVCARACSQDDAGRERLRDAQERYQKRLADELNRADACGNGLM